MEEMVHLGHSKANAFFKGYKRSRGGYYEFWRLRRYWKYLYYKNSSWK
jgi:hypothetical protein